MKKFLLSFLLAVVSCGHHGKTSPAPADLSPYDTAVQKVPGFSNPSGWIVTRDSAGNPSDLGDSLVFSGIALANLDCAAGAPIADSIEAMLLAEGGGAYRHPTLTDQISLDGLLGMYSGILARVERCGETTRWTTALDGHKAWTLAAGSAALPAEFNVDRDALLSKLGLASAPTEASVAALDVEVAGWAEADLLSKSSCYRLNLGLLALQEAGASATGSSLFCSATKNAGIPLIDQYCGRPGLSAWISAFQPNTYNYAFQRCPAWEGPDLDGGSALGVDMLAGWTALYGAPQ